MSETLTKKRLRDAEYRHKNRALLRVKAKQHNFNRDLRRVGITKEYHDQLYNKQNGLCAICRKPFIDETPCIDHCHQTGKVRGLLHKKCNAGIGLFNDDPNLIKLALEYLTTT